MKLRFAVNQAEAMRRGIDAPKSIVTIDVDPAKLSQEERDLIADRMEGIDVCLLASASPARASRRMNWEDGSPRHVVALEPTYDALMEGIRDNQLEVDPFTILSPRVSKGLPADPQNARNVLGWGVYHHDAGHLYAVRASEEEASAMRKKVGAEYVVAFGSHRLGTNVFVIGGTGEIVTGESEFAA
jgi:hypothetical protein